MGIRKLLLEAIVVLAVTTSLVIALNSFQIHHNASEHFAKLQEQYFDATYDIYKDEIIGDLLINNLQIENALLNEISLRRSIGVSVLYQGNEVHVGDKGKNVESKSYKLDLGSGNEAVVSLYSLSDFKSPWSAREVGVALLLELLVLSLGFIYLWWHFRDKLLAPLAHLVTHLQPGLLEDFVPNVNALDEIKHLGTVLQQMNVAIQKQAYSEAKVRAAKQVAHDIRSPLASLNLLLSHISTLPDEQRTLMRSAIRRITDIANSLYSTCQKGRNDICGDDLAEGVMLSSLIDALVSEKRVQLKNKSNIIIDANLEAAYGLFVKIDSVEFKRVLSNLINNSVEAFGDKAHAVHLVVTKVNEFIQITIQDDGKGMPAEVLNKVGQYGFSYGKVTTANSGSGLGIFHAIKTINNFGGSFDIVSTENVGTTVTIKLLSSEVPNWFVKALYLENIKLIIILDDDESVHNVWRERLGKVANKELQLKFFACDDDFRAYLQAESELVNSTTLFLMDYELLQQQSTGLDLIEAFGLAKYSVLITSHYEETSIKTRVNKIGVKMIPKSLAAYVPLLVV